MNIENNNNAQQNEILLYILWIVTVAATAGSLFFSEVMQLPPCILCWYQRIAMYPLIVIIGAGIIMRDQRMPFYALPLSLIGLGISIYHNLLYYKLIPDHISPCTQGLSCTTVQIEWLGFITIPFMALVSFILTSAGLVFLIFNSKKGRV